MLGGLGSILYAILLFINAMAILNEERFLARIGWSSRGAQMHTFHQAYDPYSGTAANTQQDLTVKAKLVNLIGAVRTLMRVPLIFINVGVIIYELI